MSPTPEEWSKLKSSKELHKKSLEMLSEKDSFLGGGLDNIEQPTDHINYDQKTGDMRWMFDTSTDTFTMLHLPFFFEKAPENVKHDLIEWCRAICVARYETKTEPPTIPESVRAFRDLPETKALRSAAKTGQSSLEAWE